MLVWIDHWALFKPVEGNFLSIDGWKWILIFCLYQYFSRLTVAWRVIYMRYLWRSKLCPDSSCLETVVWTVTESVNTTSLYAFPAWIFYLGRCTIHFHMKYYLNLTSLLESFWLCHNILWQYCCLELIYSLVALRLKGQMLLLDWKCLPVPIKLLECWIGPRGPVLPVWYVSPKPQLSGLV